MHPTAQSLSNDFISAFASADHDITWLAAEEERQLWLSPNTVLIGKIDARGLTGDGQPFFADWKTLSNYRARYIEEEKLKWRTDPQALTYGVLLAEWCTRFTVRWAIKPNAKGVGSATAFEWYTYTEAEIAHWRKQLLRVAEEIRWNRGNSEVDAAGESWLTNFGNCYRYGVKYPCPFIDKCAAQDWARASQSPRKPHTALEAAWASGVPPQMWGPHDVPPDYEQYNKNIGELVVLSSSRVDDYLGCPEMYRNKWEGDGFSEQNENLTIGTDFHTLQEQHIRSMIVRGANDARAKQ